MTKNPQVLSMKNCLKIALDGWISKLFKKKDGVHGAMAGNNERGKAIVSCK